MITTKHHFGFNLCRAFVVVVVTVEVLVVVVDVVVMVLVVVVLVLVVLVVVVSARGWTHWILRFGFASKMLGKNTPKIMVYWWYTMIESVKHHRIYPSTENILPETDMAVEIGWLRWKMKSPLRNQSTIYKCFVRILPNNDWGIIELKLNLFFGTPQLGPYL